MVTERFIAQARRDDCTMLQVIIEVNTVVGRDVVLHVPPR
uniref:Uncharacterized protein n=1 Tax=Anguilla anguilla TaxID=7936 RepID=A0A0E9PNM6_ANGAN